MKGCYVGSVTHEPPPAVTAAIRRFRALLERRFNAGTLTPDEDAEYKGFVEAVDVVSILQAKARRFLSRRSA